MDKLSSAKDMNLEVQAEIKVRGISQMSKSELNVLCSWMEKQIKYIRKNRELLSTRFVARLHREKR